MADPVASLVKGTLDLLVLRTLQLEPLHGAAIAERIFQITRGTFHIKAGSLFPALRRLEQSGWIEGEWAASDSNRRARFYRLTRSGRARLNEEKRSWYRMASAMTWMLESEG